MKEVCLKCHAANSVDEFFNDAEVVVESTNATVREGREIIEELRSEGLLTDQPFDETIEFIFFDFWHYYGRTAKHGAFMGGADFVQWHGNYELLAKLTDEGALRLVPTARAAATILRSLRRAVALASSEQILAKLDDGRWPNEAPLLLLSARLAEAISPTLDLPTGAEELVRDVILGLAPVLRL